jgi:hypothetical protein
MGVFYWTRRIAEQTAVCVVDRDGAVLWQGKVPSLPGLARVEGLLPLRNRRGSGNCS